MATVYGAWAPNSSTNQRMRLRLDYTVPTPSPGQTSVTVTGTIRVGAYYGFTWRHDPILSWSGTLLGSGSQQKDVIVSTGGETQIHSFSVSVPIGTSASSKTVNFALTGVGYVGSRTVARVSATVALPARATVAAPTSVAITRVSNTRVRVTWGGGTAHDVQLRRRAVAGSNTSAWGPWTTFGSMGTARASGVEYNVASGYVWQAAVRRQAGSSWSLYTWSSNTASTFEAPNPPTGVTVTRQADDRHTLSWSVATSASTPIVDQVVQRWSHTHPNWMKVATVGSSSRAWVDTQNLANHEIKYRVITRNAINVGTGDSAPFRTTPYAPRNVTATRTGPAAALLTWDNSPTRIATSQKIQAQTSSDLGVTWSEWGDLPGHTGITPVAQSRAIGSLDASLWYRFRVVAVADNTAPYPTLYGYSASTDIIRPAAKPNPPSPLAPSGVVSSAEPVEFRWRHNPTDGSDQTAYELQYRPAGSIEWVTVTGTSTNVQRASAEITTPDLYEWRVRTRGQHADWSDWSAVGAFEVLHPPSVTIVSPVDGGTHPSNRAEVVIDFTDATGAVMTGWRAELHALDGDGELIENRAGSGATGVIRFDTILDNFTGYAVWVWATSGTGLESSVAVTEFSTDFLPPADPSLDADWIEPDGLVRLDVENHPGDDVTTVETVHNRVERSIDLGQTWETIADDMPLFVGLEDDMVPLNTRVLYRAVAVSEWDTEAVSEVLEVDTTTDKLWLMGLTNGARISLECDLSMDPTFEQERVSEQYYGRTWPYSHYGEHRVVQVAVSATWAIQGIPCNSGIGTANDPHDLFGQDLWYRDPAGRAFRAGFSSAISMSQDNHWVQTVGFTVERVQV